MGYTKFSINDEFFIILAKIRFSGIFHQNSLKLKLYNDYQYFSFLSIAGSG